ncbi:hypothetical protein Cgig2_032317 [Carnegiea gigantea]|uniref:Uncharacterized protein n=1 Tax=Carnegiea gigantea TaxID=171969 RepID=A0A9Q1KIY2_9CARY|nr:hypothetical protein Cgig2_032317 [Carnegiea gigantea]
MRSPSNITSIVALAKHGMVIKVNFLVGLIVLTMDKLEEKVDSRLEVVGAVAGWRSPMLLLVGGRRCYCWSRLFCGGLLCARWLVGGWPAVAMVHAFTLGSRLILSSKLSIEGLVRIGEEYFEGVLEPPTVIEVVATKQLRSAVGQAISVIEQLPLPLRDVMSSEI